MTLASEKRAFNIYIRRKCAYIDYAHRHRLILKQNTGSHFSIALPRLIVSLSRGCNLVPFQFALLHKIAVYSA